MREILFEHAFVLEVVVFLIATVGMSFNLLGLYHALRDKKDLIRHKLNGPRTLIANSAIQQETLRLTVQILIMAMSFVHLLYPPPPPTMRYDGMWDGMVYDQILMIGITALLAVKSILDYSERQRLLAVVMEQLERRRVAHDSAYYGKERRHDH